MQRSGLMLGGAVMALALSLGAPALGQDVDFGEDTSTWANDGQCDDPRFSGPGAALIRSPIDELRDATDCRNAFEAGEITLATAKDTAGPDTADGDIDFGDDSGNWANDGECDDPRFGDTLTNHLRADATDCRTAYEAGDVTYAPDADAGAAVAIEGDIDFGDDSGNWANDGECDDPRFGGTLSSHLRADATDCRNAYEAGDVTYTTPAAPGEIDFGTDAGSFANDGECDDPRFGGVLTSHELADATDCRAAYEAGEVTYTAPAEYADVTVDGIDFGDDSGNWANDGECDDPRFGGTLSSHEYADATDCLAAYEAGEVTYAPIADPVQTTPIGDIDFGDDSGNWANDGECDDPRFIGRGVGASLEDHRMADATDCRTAYEQGTIALASENTELNGESRINFGDDSGNWANDGECDDPRFTGEGVGVALDDHLMADATDCRTAYEAGTLTLASEDGGGDFRINFGDDSSVSAFDGICDDPRFQGRGGAPVLLEANLMADATDCRAAHDAGTVSYNP